jgi:hypothetical protein
MRLPGRVLMEDVMSDKYVDAYVMPVPKSKVDGYKAFSKRSALSSRSMEPSSTWTALPMT